MEQSRQRSDRETCCIQKFRKFRKFKLATWEQRFLGFFFWTLHSKLQFILVETFWRIYDLSRINCWSLWNSYSQRLQSWIGSDRNQWSDHHWLQRTYVEIDDSTEWQSDWNYECQNLCGSVTNESKPGRTKLNCIWKIVISKIRIKLMESRWSSSGKYSQDSLHWTFSKRLKIYVWITVWSRAVQRKDHLHVNVLRTRKHRKCIVTFVYGRRFMLGLWSFSGLWSEKKWYGTYSDKPDGKWDKTAERMMLNFAESGHPIFRATSPGRRWIRNQRKGKEVYSLQRQWRNNWIDSSHHCLCKSAQYLRSSSRFMQIIVQGFRGCEEICGEWRFGISGNTNKTSCCWSSHQRGVVGKLAARLWT